MSDKNKMIFILLDGCGFDVAESNLGYLEHLIEKNQGAKYRVRGELPSSSRPIYETLFTGLPPYQHGIIENHTPSRSRKDSIFDLCCKQGYITAAAAYYWISELYVATPFDPSLHRYNLLSDSSIKHGIYYYEDCYPDSHVFSDAEFLRTQYTPDFLFIHPMNPDDSGHHFGCHSKEHHSTILKVNEILAVLMPRWIEFGYQVVITADHGMNEIGLHGGNSQLQRTVALYLFSQGLKKGDFSKNAIPQISVAPLLCTLLGVEPSSEMSNLSDLGVDIFE